MCSTPTTSGWREPRDCVQCESWCATALRNALIPLTTVVAIDFASLFGGAIGTEKVFDWQGMGSLLVTAVTQVDLNTTLAWLMVTAVIVILFNLLADVLYGVLDPRIRV